MEQDPCVLLRVLLSAELSQQCVGNSKCWKPDISKEVVQLGFPSWKGQNITVGKRDMVPAVQRGRLVVFFLGGSDASLHLVDSRILELFSS